MGNLTESEVITGVPGTERIIQESEKEVNKAVVKIAVSHLNFYYGPRQVLLTSRWTLRTARSQR